MSCASECAPVFVSPAPFALGLVTCFEHSVVAQHFCVRKRVCSFRLCTAPAHVHPTSRPIQIVACRPYRIENDIRNHAHLGFSNGVIGRWERDDAQYTEQLSVVRSARMHAAATTAESCMVEVRTLARELSTCASSSVRDTLRKKLLRKQGDLRKAIVDWCVTCEFSLYLRLRACMPDRCPMHVRMRTHAHACC